MDRPLGSIDLDHPLVADLLARCRFAPPAAELVCAVSGGPDSLALLVLAAAWSRRAHPVVAVHVDHGLRPGSAAEAEVVAGVAAAVGAGFRAESVVVEPGPNLEERARLARRSVLPAGALTGHTADDRAETMLLNLLRGAGPTGLAAMGPSPRRPLLELRRSETRALCAALGLQPVDDPSNRDPVHLRNRVRHELLPLLADLSDRDPVPVLVRQGDLFASVDELVRREAAELDPTSVAELRAAPDVVAGEAVRTWLVAAGVGDGRPVDAASVERILAVVGHRAVATQVAGGWRVSRSAGRLHLTPPT